MRTNGESIISADKRRNAGAMAREGVEADTMTEAPDLHLVRAKKAIGGNVDRDDYDVREGAPGGRLVGRVYKLSVAPTGKWWFWVVQIPNAGAKSGAAETAEAAMAELRAEWSRSR